MARITIATDQTVWMHWLTITLYALYFFMLLLSSADLQTVRTQTGLPNKMSDLVWIHLLFDALMVFLKKFSKKVELEKNRMTA